jgi:hypothetical protein
MPPLLPELAAVLPAAPDLMDRLVAEFTATAAKPPFPDVQQGIVALMNQRMAAVRDSGDACLRLLPSILREPATSGPIHGVGYNAGVQVVKTEDPPIGQRRPGRPAKPSVVRINGRDFLRVDYDRPVPQYLKVWRSAFERAVTAHPDAYENLLAGGDGEASLRDIWKNARTLRPLSVLSGDVRLLASPVLGTTPLVDNVDFTVPASV